MFFRNLLIISSIFLSYTSFGQNCLIAHYNLNGNTNNQAQGLYNGVGTNIVSTTDHLGNSNGAYSFNGTSSHIEIATNDFDYPERTVCVWFNVTSFSATRGVIYASDHPNIQNGLTVLTTTQVNSINYLRYNYGGQVRDIPIQTNTWYFAAIVVSANGGKYYLNCNLVNNVNNANIKSVDGSTSTFIGKDRLSGRYLNGIVDDVKIYDCALTKSELETISGLDCTTDSCQASNSFQKIIGENGTEVNGKSTIIETYDGNILISSLVPGANSNTYGDFSLKKLDANGNLIWNKKFNANSYLYYGGLYLLEDSQHNILITGVSRQSNSSRANITLLKLDENGNEIWNKTYDHNEGTWASSKQIYESLDGTGYLIPAYYLSNGNNDYRHCLIKVDWNGSIIWVSGFGGGGQDAMILSTIQLNSGNMIHCSSTSSFGSGDINISIIKTNSSGAVLWYKTIGEANRKDARAMMKYSTDNHLILAANVESYGTNGLKNDLICKLDTNGNIIWSKLINSANSKFSWNSLEITDSNEIIFFGNTEINGNSDFYVSKIDRNGNLMDYKVFGSINDEFAFGVMQHSNGYLYSVGLTDSLRKDTFDMQLSSFNTCFDNICNKKPIQLTDINLNITAISRTASIFNTNFTSSNLTFNVSSPNLIDSMICSIVIAPPPPPKNCFVDGAISIIDEKETYCIGDSINFTTSFNEKYAFNWYLNEQLLSTDQNLSYTISADTNNISLEITNVVDSCTSTKSYILIASDCEIESKIIPNIITPNSDGTNDHFVIKGFSTPLLLTIYNRWGKAVYSNTNYLNNWDGQDLSDGSYYYHLIDSNHQSYKGWVQILR